MNKDEMKMIDAMCKVLNFNCKIECDKCQANDFCSTYFECKALYNANCRIIADDEIVIKKSEYEELSKDYATINNEAYYCGMNVSKQETAEEILQIIDSKLDLYRNGVIGRTLYDDGYKSAVNEIKIAVKNKYSIELE